MLRVNIIVSAFFALCAVFISLFGCRQKQYGSAAAVGRCRFSTILSYCFARRIQKYRSRAYCYCCNLLHTYCTILISKYQNNKFFSSLFGIIVRYKTIVLHTEQHRIFLALKRFTTIIQFSKIVSKC